MTNAGTLNWINEWHRRACPAPDQRAFDVQLGCHIEEITEMLAVMEIKGASIMQTRAFEALCEVSRALKAGDATAVVHDRKELLDALADQVVTATGVGYRAGMDMPRACLAVDSSNWSKFDIDGQPIFDTNGKVTKGPHYVPPSLEGLY